MKGLFVMTRCFHIVDDVTAKAIHNSNSGVNTQLLIIPSYKSRYNLLYCVAGKNPSLRFLNPDKRLYHFLYNP